MEEAIITLDDYYRVALLLNVIKSFKSKETEKIYYREYSKKFPSNIQRTALKKLWMLDAAPDLNALRVPPSNRLEALKGKRKGQYSIPINKQWRICFRWESGNAFEVEIVDYH
ncbi:type II toxin-antitoxin system RelE/ParE family toxin [candidate division KSB1 bacterium]|nr:type II toxin-antitoxin system RelE/ParE family toxin [candidate division KSB1 bacterium]NIR68648.1 type II toxin-antitoxin system RelE/ParE family toxin [candidate division KSB1 bacterium]NIS27137.1 type II toxin-antitoxin system RelE/ParE family toxin [candidate division KSB1 bacterium]NIT74023.1 type II toxin-antitoxin system RelE/ParE family toxin [candidate division KSB1 bacterium]NIU27889.1 type II toxin-antitoxin system RelE/ParE family toxin [candidate division KSB1 bacterium]